MSRRNRAIGPPPATRPTPTSHCDKIAFSRLAKLISQASASSLPFPVALPRISAIDTNGARQAHENVGPCLEAGRTLRNAGQILEIREEVGVIQTEAVDGTFDDDHLHFLVVLQRGDNLPDLRNEFRTHEVERRIVESDSAM
jgi:hypothetical protein